LSAGEFILIAAAILVPLAIAIAVTLWTLQPAVIRAERAKRSRTRSTASKPIKSVETRIEEPRSDQG
jgi:hypothetical protein